MKKATLDYEMGSDNVFADLGLPEPEECLVKAKLAMLIGNIIQQKGLTQAQAARLLNSTQPKICDLLNGRLGNFGMQRLLRFLLALDRDIQIVISPRDLSRPHSMMTVQTRAT
jgi:predicted XRE-type DNA-binding protein